MLEKLITELGEEMSLEKPFVCTEDRHYSLNFDPDIEVTLSEVDKNILCKGIIGTIPQQNTEPFLLSIMEANLFGLGTRGAVIGLDSEGKLLTLSLSFDRDSPFAYFKEKLEDFVSVLDHWRQVSLKT